MEVEVGMGAGWDFGNTSKTTALPGVCYHFLYKAESPPPQCMNLGCLDGGVHREELMKNFCERHTHRNRLDEQHN